MNANTNVIWINRDLNKEEKIKFKCQSKIAKEIGINESTLSRVLSGKQGTKKTTAYCIVKAYNPEAEIKDYFITKGE